MGSRGEGRAGSVQGGETKLAKRAHQSVEQSASEGMVERAVHTQGRLRWRAHASTTTRRFTYSDLRLVAKTAFSDLRLVAKNF